MLNTLTYKEFSFTKKNENNWILEHSEKYFIVSNEIKLLLEILKRNNNSTLAYQDFIKEFDYVSETDFNSIVSQNLKTLELDEEREEDQKKEKSFILFETKILSPEKAGKWSKLIQPLFQPTFFWISFTLLFVLAIYNISTLHHFHLDTNYMVYLFIIYIVSAFIHEFGHIAACNRFTKKNGEIGVGIYFLFPVFYSNITPIWTAKKEERIITNLAGVYVQLYIIVALFIIYLITGIHEIQDIIALSTLVILYQLIPFIRTDGYWILSDLTDSPNLLSNSNKRVIDFIKNPFKFKINNKNEVLELIYGLFNQIFMIFIVVRIILTYKTKLFTGPIDLVKTIFTHPSKTFNFLNENVELLLISIVFYLIVFNLIKRILPSQKNIQEAQH
ncbi:putative peptide zinc metalloprotease protein [Algoriella xinjiangensis]|uniref:Putative peptide zinc metalloprotease protein n=1 Tax=Algoriella xinjiangensis TaxID=684065 RepID=A0A1I4T1T0_9FLAO|nr:hypothetical protein [Algoriella xinjiangensis]SFM70543.1 putative peptide zinc metalloprotease protein [Algoriella xinjiangensis]VDH15179.1 Zn-dependent proteases [Algoriella xinjiangensis]